MSEKKSLPNNVNDILQERGSTYGPASINLRVMHDLMKAFESGQPLEAKSHPNYAAHQMAIIMIMAKLSRISTGKPHKDNYDDLIGYAKIAGDLAVPPDLSIPEFLKKPAD